MAKRPDVPADWIEANKATWDERVGLHLDADAYDLRPLREGRAHLHPIEQSDIGDVAGLRIAHLQCHFGRDSLTLAQQGAQVVGLDFSPAAIKVARELAAELGLADRATFVEADVYSAPEALSAFDRFDMVFISWGALGWLPDLERWGRVIASLLRPGGRLYLAEAHPAAMVFDDADAKLPDGRPGYYSPYLDRKTWKDDAPKDYTGDLPALEASHEYWFDHTLSDILNAIISAGLTLDWFHEHDAVPWPMFSYLTATSDGMYGWPNERWLPLAYSLSATRNGT
ncbi:class I SAM-dependent methyltransferase [Aliiroseovarius sp. 2305UL8-7]|uniref:class I SAM-dependent methyltransferase n=1 Tax=Aliiroseovarius conchicola TaxID=3121637 RepID=UPI0035278477